MSISINLKSWFQTAKLNEQSNETLMLRYAKTKDSQILASLYDNCANDLYSFLCTLAGSDLAQEIAQQTWLKVIDKSHLYKDQGKFKNWLFTLGRRTLLDEFRKQNRFVDLSEQAHDDLNSGSATFQQTTEYEQYSTEETVFQQMDDASLVNHYEAALNDLPFLQKEAFCLQQEGFSLIDIAMLTNTEAEAVKSRLRYAKNSLKKVLQSKLQMQSSDNDNSANTEVSASPSYQPSTKKSSQSHE
jgi:RNA polymerase sigma-70 factor (ECF subfamily)